MNPDTIATLHGLAVERFGDPAKALAPTDDLFDSLGIDSLHALDLLTDIEERFDVEIPDYEIQGVNTLQGLAAVIQARL